MAFDYKNNNNKPKFSVAIRSDAYQKLINETLGDKESAKQFVTDITSVVSQNSTLQKCEAGSILSAGLLAQTLKLPLASTLGFAYVVPYGDKAQFQVGWKGLVQLCIRSGKYENLGVRPVHEGEALGLDEFGDEIVKFSHEFDLKPIVGYFAYFKLTSGFRKTLYWTVEQCEAHGTRYSKAHVGKNRGGEFDNWSSNFDAMAQKTVLKQLLSKYGIMSIELQKAIEMDQAVIEDDKPVYVDNEPEPKQIEIAETKSKEVEETNPDDADF